MNKIFCGDALAVLKTLESESVHCCVTSPPYFGLRDYGVPGQIGLEKTPAEYIDHLVAVFREVRRVLRRDGVLWVNIGDRFSNDDTWGGSTGGKHTLALHGENAMRERRRTGLPPKSLMMLPARLALALQEDGWILRSDNIWFKLNPMPESVTDRPSQVHEHVFLLAKSRDYYYDADAVRLPLRPKTYTTFGTKHRPQGNDRRGLVKSDNWGKSLTERKPRLTPEGEIAGANLRSVWPLASHSYEGAHYATMPPKLAEICILAGSSPKACEYCLTPWCRITLPTGHINRREPAHVPNNSATKIDSTGWAPTRIGTNQWEPTCTCQNEGSGKCIILDPFCGAGTTPMVAIQHGRDYLGIELNQEYVDLIHQRIHEVQVSLWTSGVGT